MSAWVEREAAAYVQYRRELMVFHRVVNPPPPPFPIRFQLPCKLPDTRKPA